MGKEKKNKTQKPSKFNRMDPPTPVETAVGKPVSNPVLEYLQRDKTIKPWAKVEEPAGSRDESGRNPFHDPPKKPNWESFANQTVEDKLNMTQNKGRVATHCTKIGKEKPRTSHINRFRQPTQVKGRQNLMQTMTENDKNHIRKVIGYATRKYYGSVPLGSLEAAVDSLAKRVDLRNRRLH